MKKFTIFIFIFFILTLKANSSVITHPDNKDMTVSVDQIFFTGGVNKGEKLYINDTEICPNEIGAFCNIFQLTNGENIFNVKTTNEQGEINTEEYKIIKTEKNSKCHITTREFQTKPQYYITIKPNVILRATPINAGMNRLGYLPENTYLYIDGFKNEYLKVYLTKDEYGWVLKDDIAPVEDLFEYQAQKILSENQILNSDALVYNISLSNNLPYSVIEDNDKIILTIYNTDNNEEFIKKSFDKNELTRYSVEEKDSSISVNIKTQQNPVNLSDKKQIKIVIDAGHGGNEKGAVGCLGDLEKDINLEIAQQLKNILSLEEYEVYMTRECDEYISLNDRIKTGKEKDALLFISIHLNSVPIDMDPNEYSGTTVYYYNNSCQKLAKEVADSISQNLSVKNNGTKQASFAVIRPTEYLGILIEVAYMVNPCDTMMYKKTDFAQKVADAIRMGIEKYLQNTSKQ